MSFRNIVDMVKTIKEAVGQILEDELNTGMCTKNWSRNNSIRNRRTIKRTLPLTSENDSDKLDLHTNFTGKSPKIKKFR